MAQTWAPNFRKRFLLGALDVIARFTSGGGDVRPVGSDAPINRILVVELWNIGDVILAMPFLAQLRRLFPKARITMLARPHARTILEGTHLVDEFIEAELGWTESTVWFNPLAYNWKELRRVRRELHAREFDIAFKGRMHIREHLLLSISGARRRVAFAFGQGDRVLTDAIPIGDPDRHKVADWFELLKPFGGPVAEATPRLKVSESERREATAFLAEHGVASTDRVVGIHPGASIPEKRWPLERFAKVAETIANRSGVRVVAFVEPGGYGDSVADGEEVIPAKLTLRQLVALIDRCDVLVCNDSGPMHIAGALGVPAVAVFGSGIPQWFSPLGEGHHLLTVQKTQEDSEESAESVKPFDVIGVTTSQVLDALDSVLRANRS